MAQKSIIIVQQDVRVSNLILKSFTFKNTYDNVLILSDYLIIQDKENTFINEFFVESKIYGFVFNCEISVCIPSLLKAILQINFHCKLDIMKEN